MQCRRVVDIVQQIQYSSKNKCDFFYILLWVVGVVFPSSSKEVAPLLDEEQVRRRRKIFPIGQESVEVRNVTLGGIQELGVDRLEDEDPAKLRLGQDVDVVGQNRVQFFPGFDEGVGKLLVVVPRRQRVVGLLQQEPDLEKAAVRHGQAVFGVHADVILKTETKNANELISIGMTDLQTRPQSNKTYFRVKFDYFCKILCLPNPIKFLSWI